MEVPVAAIGLAALAAAGLAVVAAPVGPAADAAGTDHHVHIVDFAMDPDPLDVAVGDTVTWHNHDSASHTATEGSPDDGREAEWTTGTISSGGSASVTFESAASYEYFCEVHPTTMNGFGLDVVKPPTVSVDAPDDGATVSGTVDVSGSASDPDGTVDRVEVRIDDGSWREAQGTTSWSFTWDTSDADEGSHTIHARSFDGSVFSDVATVEVTVDNPRPDLVTRDLHVDDRTLGREVKLQATVVNAGGTEAAGTGALFTYEVRNETREIAAPSVGALGPGASTTVEVTWDTRGQVGEFPVRAAADAGDAVVEEAEDNNADETTVCFPGEDAACRVPGADPAGTVRG